MRAPCRSRYDGERLWPKRDTGVVVALKNERHCGARGSSHGSRSLAGGRSSRVRRQAQGGLQGRRRVSQPSSSETETTSKIISTRAGGSGVGDGGKACMRAYRGSPRAWSSRRRLERPGALTFPLVSLVMNCALGISFGSGSVEVRRVALLRELGELRYRENWTFGTPGGPESRFRVLESEKGKNAS